MNHDEVLATFDAQMRRNARPDGPGARVDRTDTTTRQTGGESGWNGVLWSGLDAESADPVIAEQVEHFTGLGLEFEWKLYAHDLPHDLPQRLLAAGFTAEPQEALMVAEADRQSTAATPPEGITLREVTDEAGVDLMAVVHDQAFGTDGSRIRRQLLKQLTEAPETVVAVVAMAGDVPVSSARVEFVPGTDFAGLWGGGTVAAWRGRGIFRTLVAYRARIAAERGYRYLQVDASDQSRPILARLGFAQLSTTTPYVYQPKS
ncbi:GNAT family N-acetyltransferase [Planotetraspora kaengkrachanensis]|uniref:N-acetyltransferase domain-containing protein n=1 Tax=Planotetraspora kaengkrachanensis TaxID=575193 RepID=A0A8J3LZS9_9ACTN|nr:GNAT family N-acetyltransferase [Planotetraspora kaengkrachanensis]GIG79453.1 hypothetical protein Pka01_25800 [Planotetraspora kaengkrachanensis]